MQAKQITQSWQFEFFISSRIYETLQPRYETKVVYHVRAKQPNYPRKICLPLNCMISSCRITTATFVFLFYFIPHELLLQLEILYNKKRKITHDIWLQHAN